MTKLMVPVLKKCYWMFNFVVYLIGEPVMKKMLWIAFKVKNISLVWTIFGLIDAIKLCNLARFIYLKK